MRELSRPDSFPDNVLRVAVLYQEVEPPIINGVRKPKKPGGYRDSSADIAYVLQSNGTSVVTNSDLPDPQNDAAWCFPDTEAGILAAVDKGATHLWCNTILFATHPLQTSPLLDSIQNRLRIVGQPPQLVEQYDDKNYVNTLLRKDGSFDMPRFCTANSIDLKSMNSLGYPIVGKPIRGRGSHGVKVCHTEEELISHLKEILSESPRVILEEYLSGQEGTITVMPSSEDVPRYTALPMVLRFNHQDGIAPYNGIVAVTMNSRVISDDEMQSSTTYAAVCRQCERVAERLKVTAPIRIDVRQYSNAPNAKFAIFDVNVKPNMTGPGRPGREDQASLTAIAAAKLGWDYPDLLHRMLRSAQTLEELRQMNVAE